jgi:RNA polymerase sigma-70 factor (ECF subfamily)
VTDQEIILELANGDTSQLPEIISRYGGYVAAVVRNVVGSALTEEDRDEVIADVFVSLWKNASRIDTDADLKPWLAVVSRNAAINKARGPRSVNTLYDTYLVDADVDVERSAVTSESSTILRDSLAVLSIHDQAIFQRYYFWQQSISTIARDMDINESTIKSRLYRGREKLKIELSRKGYAL